ncbi:TPA: hypothetical protein WN250_001768 [Neisseria gonorrhoeae]
MKTFLHTQRKNFLDGISLHDCYRTAIKVEGRNVCFDFEDGFVVLDNNPNNQAGKHLKTDFSRVVLTHENRNAEDDYLVDIFEDIVFLGKRLFTVRKFLDFSELLEMINAQGYFLEFLYLYECIGVKTSNYFLEAVLVTGRSRECKKCFIKIMRASSFVYQWNNLRLNSEIV